MDEMIKLLEIILNFENKMISFWISCIQSINEQNEIIKKYNLELMNYFNNFKSINLENIINNIPSDGILEDYRFKELTSVFGYLYEISQEYDINCINDIIYKLLSIWDLNHTADSLFIKKLMRIICSSQFDFISNKYMDKLLLGKIYIDLVNCSIIDPNEIVGFSSEPLYELLPIGIEYYDTNLKVISNPLINWNMYSNGSHTLDRMCCDYTNSKEKSKEFETKYYHDAIMCAIKSSCSIFNDIFENHGIKKYEPLYVRLMGFSKYNSHLKDKEFIEEIKEYILSDEGFSHQLDLYTYHNEISDKIIEELKAEREKKKIKSYKKL